MEIILELKDARHLLIDRDSLFFGKRLLSPHAEEYIIEEATKASQRSNFHLKVHFLENSPGGQGEIIKAIHQHFAYRKEKSQRQLKETFQLGLRSLLISIVFLGFLLSMALVIIKLVPEGSFSITIREVLIILGWVALWRPADLLLYEWRPYKRDVILFGRLEHCKVEIITG
ncbi:MAG: hypothetical protein ACXWB9_09660 [Flavisolibacter sp.]